MIHLLIWIFSIEFDLFVHLDFYFQVYFSKGKREYNIRFIQYVFFLSCSFFLSFFFLQQTKLDLSQVATPHNLVFVPGGHSPQSCLYLCSLKNKPVFPCFKYLSLYEQGFLCTPAPACSNLSLFALSLSPFVFVLYVRF